MEDYQIRVVGESQLLEHKIKKLREFKNTKTFKDMEKKSRDLLNKQFKYMNKYNYVLQKRIVEFLFDENKP